MSNEDTSKMTRPQLMAYHSAELGRLQREADEEFKAGIRARAMEAIKGLSLEGMKELSKQIQEHVSRECYDVDDE